MSNHEFNFERQINAMVEAGAEAGYTKEILFTALAEAFEKAAGELQSYLAGETKLPLLSISEEACQEVLDVPKEEIERRIESLNKQAQSFRMLAREG